MEIIMGGNKEGEINEEGGCSLEFPVDMSQ